MTPEQKKVFLALCNAHAIYREAAIHRTEMIALCRQAGISTGTLKQAGLYE